MTTARPISLRDGALVAAVAMAARVAYLVSFSGSPFAAAPILDSAFHHGMALDFAGGDLLAGAPYFRPPLFPWLLGIAYSLLGADPLWGGCLNAAAGTVTAVLIWATAARLDLPRWACLAAGLLAALHAPSLFFTGELVGASLAGSLGAAGLLAGVTVWKSPFSDRRDTLLWAAASAAWAAAALARGAMGLLPVGLVFLAVLSGAGRWRRAATAILVTVVVWAGPAWIMSRTGEGFRFPSTQAGVNFYAGNHTGADGRSVDVPEMGSTLGWMDFPEASRRAAAREAGSRLTASQASDFWLARGLRFWRDTPLEAVRLTAAKSVYLIHGFEAPNNRSLYAARNDVPWLSAILWRIPGAYFPGGLLLPLALAGLWVVRRRRAWAPVVVFALLSLAPLVVFFLCSRFRVPSLAPLVLLAVVAMGAVLRRRPTALAIFGVAYVLANIPWAAAVREDPAGEALLRGEAWLNAGNPARAETEYTEARGLGLDDGRGHLGLAVARENQRDFAGALLRLDQAAPRLEGEWAYEEVRARVLHRSDRPLEALPHIESAIRAYPELDRLRVRRAQILEAAGRDSAATQAYLEIEAGGTRDAEVYNSLGRYHRLAGRRLEAMRAWNRAVELAPDHFRARFNRALIRAEAGDLTGARDDLLVATRLAPSPEDAARVREAQRLMEDAAP